MRILFDTNVLLDVLFARDPHCFYSGRLMARVELGELEGAIAATAVTTTFYLARKALGIKKARQSIENMLRLFTVASVTHDVLVNACRQSIGDFEDAVVHEAGRLISADGIVTRNTRDFKNSTIRIYTPKELDTLLAAH